MSSFLADNLATLTSGATGGALIGLAAAVLLLFNGDILGCSGIVSNGYIRHPKEILSDASAHWKLLLIAAMTATAYATYTPLSIALATAAEGGEEEEEEGATVGTPRLSAIGFAVAGLLVGFGTKLGNGCTSGHGICGLGRLSKRSFVAVCSFMVTSIITTTFLSTPPSWLSPLYAAATNATALASPDPDIAIKVVTALVGTGLIVVILAKLQGHTTTMSTQKFGPAVISGVLFAMGLQISGMAQSAKVNGFLDLYRLSNGSWDPTLAAVMGAGVVVSWMSYQFVPGHQRVASCPTLTSPVALKAAKNNNGKQVDEDGKFCVPTNQTIGDNLLLGGAIFGVGWGIAGICPGPAVVQAGVGVPGVVQYWWPAYFLGAYLADEYKKL